MNCNFVVLPRGYMCRVTEVNTANAVNAIERFNGVHVPRNNKAVTAFEIIGTEINFRLSDLHKQFPNLTHLYMTHCKLKNISKADLVGLRNLVTFCATRNELTSLPNNLFEGMNELTYIDFSGNENLKYVSSELLRSTNIKNLTHVGFLSTPINAFYEKNVTRNILDEGTVSSIEELMTIIDEKCQNLDEDRL